MTRKRRRNGYQFTQCRGPIRHRWEAIGPIVGRQRRTSFGTEATFRCEVCGTVKIYLLSRLTGDVISSPQYIHPDGYKTDRHDSVVLAGHLDGFGSRTTCCSTGRTDLCGVRWVHPREETDRGAQRP